MREVILEELSSPGCHNCAAFKAMWEEMKSDWPSVQFREVSLMDPEGQEMVQKYQIFASPGIVINGELFSTGGVNREEFITKLTELTKE